jgi:chromosome segregation ATPase
MSKPGPKPNSTVAPALAKPASSPGPAKKSPAPAAPQSPAQQPPAAAAGGSTADSLRAELSQVTSLLQETDEALDEWVAECERLQGLVLGKDAELRTLVDTVNELRQEVLKYEERLSASAQPGSAPVTRGAAGGGTPASDAALREQLVQAQTWVKQGLEKLKEAEARALGEKKRADQLAAGNGAGEAARLGNVVHAHELELAKLRQLVGALRAENAEAKALVGLLQAKSTVLMFQLEQARGEEEGLLAWIRSTLRWASKV